MDSNHNAVHNSRSASLSLLLLPCSLGCRLAASRTAGARLGPFTLIRRAPSLRLSLPPFFGRLVGSSGFEPPTSRLSGVRSNQLSYEPIPGGDERVRTDGLLLARQALSQLSYTPVFGCDQLSRSTLQQSEDVLTPSKPYSAFDAFLTLSSFPRPSLFLGLHLRKEVIQPHLPIRLPCYDFTPVIDLTFDGSLLCRLGYRLRALSTPMV